MTIKLDHAGRYLDWLHLGVAEGLKEHNAIRCPELIRTLPTWDTDWVHVAVVDNGSWKAALKLTQGELDRIWASIDRGDLRPVEMYVIPKKEFA